MKILVIVITYNGLEMIEKCINSLVFSSLKLDVICVDNKSTDSTVDFIKNRFPDVYIVENQQNIGFGRANNIGFKYALKHNYDFSFMLNQDAWVENDTIELLVEQSLLNQQFALLSPVHLNGTGDRFDINFSIYINEIKCNGLISDIFLGRNQKEIYEIPFVNAAAWLLPINTLKNIGGFDPIFFHYGDDDNYCQRILFHGLKIGIVPQSKMYHDRNQQFKYPYLFEDLRTFDRMVKPKLADINKDLDESFKRQKRELDSFIYYSIVDFKIWRVFKLFKFRSHLIKMKVEIKKSIEMNKKTGCNHLNESFDIHSDPQF